MTTTEIIANFMKGNTKVSISDKQLAWLMGQAKREGVAVGTDGFNPTIYFNDCMYQIRNCKRAASGGSYVGTRTIQGRYNMERLFTIRFKSTGLTNVASQTDLDHYTREGHQFEIIPPHVKNPQQ